MEIYRFFIENFRPEAYGLPPYEVKDDGDDQDDGVDDQNDEDSHLWRTRLDYQDDRFEDEVEVRRD